MTSQKGVVSSADLNNPPTASQICTLRLPTVLWCVWVRLLCLLAFHLCVFIDQVLCLLAAELIRLSIITTTITKLGFASKVTWFTTGWFYICLELSVFSRKYVVKVFVLSSQSWQYADLDISCANPPTLRCGADHIPNKNCAPACQSSVCR